MGISVWIGYPIIFLAICYLAWAVLLGRILLFFPFQLVERGNATALMTIHGSWVHFLESANGDCITINVIARSILRRGKKFMELIPEVTEPPSQWVNIK